MSKLNQMGVWVGGLAVRICAGAKKSIGLLTYKQLQFQINMYSMAHNHDKNNPTNDQLI